MFFLNRSLEETHSTPVRIDGRTVISARGRAGSSGTRGQPADDKEHVAAHWARARASHKISKLEND